MPGEPQNVRASAVNSSSVRVDWDPPAEDDRNGVIRGYQIFVEPKNTVSVYWFFLWEIVFMDLFDFF